MGCKSCAKKAAAYGARFAKKPSKPTLSKDCVYTREELEAKMQEYLNKKLTQKAQWAKRQLNIYDTDCNKYIKYLG